MLSAEAYSKHGFNIHGVVFDELHTQPNRKLFDVMTKGSGDARMQLLYFLITTAGTAPPALSATRYTRRSRTFCRDARSIRPSISLSTARMNRTIGQTPRCGKRRILPSSDNFAADGRVYYKISEVRVELYTDIKDVSAEQAVEAVLDRHGIFYEKSETWIDSEKLYEVLYRFETEGLQ